MSERNRGRGKDRSNKVNNGQTMEKDMREEWKMNGRWQKMEGGLKGKQDEGLKE